MKIAFYANHRYWGGLANNGGSRTILLSCKTLRDMGHNANVVTCSDKFEWFAHPKTWKKIPKDVDVVVAVSISEVEAIQNMNIRKAYWSRPFETWQKPEHKCLEIMKKFELRGGKVMVNSRWQYEYLFDKGVHPYLVYNGIDFKNWKNIGIRPLKKTPTILCQYSKNKLKGYKTFKALKKIAPEFNYISFGKDKKVKWPEIVRYYNDADYFLAPGKKEGWNNCAAEAALCGCSLVVSDSPYNGTSDFITPDNSIVYREIGEAVGRVRAGDKGRIEDIQDRLHTIGTRKKCMETLVETLR